MSTNSETKCIYLDPLESHQYTLIFFHGLGDSGKPFKEMFGDEYLAPKTCRIVLPTAPRQAVSVNDGYVMNSWFDIHQLNDGKREKGFFNKNKKPEIPISQWFCQKSLFSMVDQIHATIVEEVSKFEDKD